MNIKSIKIYNTTYEDGTEWIEFEHINGDKTFEIKEASSKMAKEYKLSHKPKVNELCSERLARYVYDLLQTENEMLYIEAEDITEAELLALKCELKEFKNECIPEIMEYIEFGNDPVITFYGGLITKFRF